MQQDAFDVRPSTPSGHSALQVVSCHLPAGVYFEVERDLITMTAAHQGRIRLTQNLFPSDAEAVLPATIAAYIILKKNSTRRVSNIRSSAIKTFNFRLNTCISQAFSPSVQQFHQSCK